jgi:hypothetical protein
VLEEEQERLKQKLVEDLLSASSQDQEDESSKQLWVTWKVEAGARAYTEEEIRRIFFKVTFESLNSDFWIASGNEEVKGIHLMIVSLFL